MPDYIRVRNMTGTTYENEDMLLAISDVAGNIFKARRILTPTRGAFLQISYAAPYGPEVVELFGSSADEARVELLKNLVGGE